MKIKTLFAALATALIASTALASGNHTGGHHADSNAIGQPGKAGIRILAALKHSWRVV